MSFKNIIILQGQCGFAHGGRIAFIKNNDTRNPYDVTVEESWRAGIDNGTQVFVRRVPAGGRERLNCTSSTGIPNVKRSFKVLGEDLINT